MIVRECKVNNRIISIRCQGVETFFCAARQCQCGGAAFGVDYTNIFHEHAGFEPRTHRLGIGFFGGEAFGVGSCLRIRSACGLGSLHLGKNAIFKTLAKAVQRILDAFDVAEV